MKDDAAQFDRTQTPDNAHQDLGTSSGPLRLPRDLVNHLSSATLTHHVAHSQLHLGKAKLGQGTAGVASNLADG